MLYFVIKILFRFIKLVTEQQLPDQEGTGQSDKLSGPTVDSQSEQVLVDSLGNLPEQSRCSEQGVSDFLRPDQDGDEGSHDSQSQSATGTSTDQLKKQTDNASGPQQVPEGQAEPVELTSGLNLSAWENDIKKTLHEAPNVNTHFYLIVKENLS